MNRVLDPIVYWKLRAICADAQRNYVTVIQAQEALITAQKKQKAMLVELELDPEMQNFQLNDDTLTISDGQK